MRNSKELITPRIIKYIELHNTYEPAGSKYGIAYLLTVLSTNISIYISKVLFFKGVYFHTGTSSGNVNTVKECRFMFFLNISEMEVSIVALVIKQ
jgi:hypothetical protein